ncbi:MAG TPA: aldo/keto reductase [Gemmatimonadaceae bacterium]|nr:aldo/keto reductase [Gemmatimonadaceae bacterium]
MEITRLETPIGLGCMRLSTAPDRDDGRSISVIHAALDAGARLLDTADAYCHDDSEAGHNERLIAAALRTWSGDRSTVTVATKGGLRRPDGKWVPDGKAKSLRAACDASRRALDVDAIDLYQLHVVDPKTPLETSVRAIAALHAEGKIRRIGLCNVTVGQIEAARAIAEVASVQVSLSVFDDENLRNGVAEYCRDHGIRLIAYRPLGGERVTRIPQDPLLAEIAARHEATPEEIALAWLRDLSPLVIPIPGATRERTARSLATVARVRLSDADRVGLDARYAGRLLRVPRSARRPPLGASGDVVLVMGMPGAGKSTLARELEATGYRRLNRDARGGSLSELARALDSGIEAGERRWVLDNTYPSRRSRNEVIETAWKHGVPVRCVWVTTGIADAQVNAITRMIDAHGRLPSPEEIRERGKDDPRFIGPDAQFRYERSIEPPVLDEGFERVDERPFERGMAPTGMAARAVFLDYDDLVDARPEQGAASPHGEILRGDRRRTLERYARDGWLLFAHAWRPEVAAGRVTLDSVSDEFARIRGEVEITVACCPHAAGPPVCWCRKPIPGSMLEFALRAGVALDRSLVVASSQADRTLAQRLGVPIIDSDRFFADRT